MKTPAHVTARFVLRYGELEIGSLWLEGGVWRYQYSEEFKAQDRAKPLVGFPDATKTYVSEELWPYFAVRIPSLQQPTVQRIIREEELDAQNQVDMLTRFARRTLSSPFELEAQ